MMFLAKKTLEGFKSKPEKKEKNGTTIYEQTNLHNNQTQKEKKMLRTVWKQTANGSYLVVTCRTPIDGEPQGHFLLLKFQMAQQMILT